MCLEVLIFLLKIAEVSVFLLPFGVESGVLFHEQVEFDLEILSPPESDHHFGELILRSIVLVFEAGDLPEVVVEVIFGGRLPGDPLVELMLNLSMHSFGAIRHLYLQINIKINNSHII